MYDANTMIFWWPRTSGAKKRQGKVSKSCMQCMDGNTFISQQQALKSQQRVKPTIKLSAMEKVQRVVYRTFKRSFSLGPVLKPKPNHIRYCCFKTQFGKELDLCFIVSGKTRAGLWPFFNNLIVRRIVRTYCSSSEGRSGHHAQEMHFPSFVLELMHTTYAFPSLFI